MIDYLEHPVKRWHDRLRYDRARVVQMDVLPDLTRLAFADVGQIRSRTLRTEQLRCLVREVSWR